MVEVESSYDNMSRLNLDVFMNDFVDPAPKMTRSLIRGFTVLPPASGMVTMHDLGRVMIACKRHVPGWDIEFAQRNNGVFEWRNDEGELCVIETRDLRMPFIIDNKAADDYEQDCLLREGHQDIHLGVRNHATLRDMEKLIVISKALHEMGFQTVDWIYSA